MRQLLFLTTLILNQVSHNSADFYETQMVLKKVHTVLVFVDLFVWNLERLASYNDNKQNQQSF